MATRIKAMLDTQEILPGHNYHIMPSDCRGDGYDIALVSRPLEDGIYEINGHKIIVSCDLKAGSTQWRNGIPVRYLVAVDPQPAYRLEAGEKAELIHRTGNTIGNSYMARVMASIAIRKPDGKLKYQGHTPYWLGTTSTYASHYKSGLSKHDQAAYDADCAALQIQVDLINGTRS